MRADILATATLLTAIIGFAAPVKAEPVINSGLGTNTQAMVASSNLLQLDKNEATTELKFVTYNSYPFESVYGVVMLSHKHGIGCLVTDPEQDLSDGTVACGLIDND